MPAVKRKAASSAKQPRLAAGQRTATPARKSIKSTLPAPKKRKRRPAAQPAQEDEKEEEKEAGEAKTNDEAHADDADVAGDEDTEETQAAVKEEEAQAEVSGVGSSREQQIELDDVEGSDDLSLSSSDLEQELLQREDEEYSSAAFDELALPLRIYIGTYTGSLYALESIHSLHHLLTSPPLPPASPTSTSAATARPASSFYTLFNTDAHRASVHAVACSPQGSHLVSSGVDEVVQLYRLEGERRHVGSLHRHYASVNQLLFPSSHTFLSASDDGTVAVFSSVHQWEMVKRLSSTGTAGVVSMSLHPSHRVLLTSSSDGVVRMWDMVRGVEATRRRVKFEHPSVTAGGSGQMREEVRVQWEEAGRGYVMVRGKVLTVYDEQGAVRRVVHSDSRLLSVHFIAPSLLIAGCEDCSLRCWDGETGEQLWLQKQHTARIRCLDYLRLPDQQLLLVSASTDGQVWVWRGMNDGGMRAGVERVAGAKSEARITALSCGVRWDARRPQHQELDATTAAAQFEMDDETAEAEEKEAPATRTANAEGRGGKSKTGAKQNGSDLHVVGGKGQQRRKSIRSAESATIEESKEDGMAVARKQKQKKQKVQVNKNETAQVTSRGSETAAAGTIGKGGVTFTVNKRRTRDCS